MPTTYGREEKPLTDGCWEQPWGGSSALRGSCPPPPALEAHLSLQFLRKAGAQAQEQSQKSASAPGFSAADSQPQELGHRSARNGSAGAVSSEQRGARHGPCTPGHGFGAFSWPGRGAGSPRLLPRPAKGLAAGPRLGAAPRARPLAVPALARRPLGIFIPGICLV